MLRRAFFSRHCKTTTRKIAKASVHGPAGCSEAAPTQACRRRSVMMANGKNCPSRCTNGCFCSHCAPKKGSARRPKVTAAMDAITPIAYQSSIIGCSLRFRFPEQSGCDAEANGNRQGLFWGQGICGCISSQGDPERRRGLPVSPLLHGQNGEQRGQHEVKPSERYFRLCPNDRTHGGS